MEVSVVSLYFDEKDYIRQWIKCVLSFSNEVIIVVTGDDDTPYKVVNDEFSDEIQRIFLYRKPQNCNKFSNKWNQSEIRNYSLTLAHNNWILCLDQDETVSNNFWEVAQRHRIIGINAFAVPTINIWNNGEVRVDKPWFPDYHYRLVTKGQKYTDGNRHLTIKNVPEVRNLPNLVKLPYTLTYWDCVIVHHKYEKIVMENGVYRCHKHDYKSIEEYNRGAVTLPIKDIKMAF